MKIRVLVSQIISRQREQDADIAVQLFGILQADVRGDLRGIVGGLHPVHHRYFGFDRVVRHFWSGGKFPVCAAAIACCPTAFHPDVTRERSQQRRAARGALAAVMTLRSPALDQRSGFGGCVVARQLPNCLCRHVGDFLCPLGRFRHAIFCAAQVSHQGFIGRNAFWHSVFVKAQGVVLNKVAIVQVLRDDHIHHRVHQGVVRGGKQRDPLIGQGGNRIGIARVDNNKASAVLLHLLVEVVAVTKDRFRRVMSPEDDQFGVQQRVKRTAAGSGAIGIRRCCRRVTHTDRVIAFEIAAG